MRTNCKIRVPFIKLYLNCDVSHKVLKLYQCVHGCMRERRAGSWEGGACVGRWDLPMKELSRNVVDIGDGAKSRSVDTIIML